MSLSVSIVIPTVDGGDALISCVESIATDGAGEVQLIIVDNGSRDGSVAKTTGIVPNTVVIRNEYNVGFAPACNQGARESTKDWLLFLNNDAQIHGRSIGQLVTSAETLGASIIQPMILDEFGAPDSAGDLFTRWGFMWHLTDRPGDPRQIFATKGACMLVERKVFEQLGGFQDSYFAYFEETDLCWRARMTGHQIWVEPAIEVRHIGGHTTARILKPGKIYHLSFRNRLRSVIANPSTASLFSILPLHLIGCLGAVLAFALRGRLDVAAGIVKAILWPLTNLPLMRAQRRHCQLQRLASDPEVFRDGVSVRLTGRLALSLLKGTLGRWTGR